MKTSVAVITLSAVLLTASAAYSGTPVAFTEREAGITENGAVTDGRVFVRANDPATLLVLSGHAAFLINKTVRAVWEVAVNRVNDTADPVLVDYRILSKVEGAGLIVGDDGEVSFLAGGNRYDVRPPGRGPLTPE